MKKKILLHFLSSFALLAYGHAADEALKPIMDCDVPESIRETNTSKDEGDWIGDAYVAARRIAAAPTPRDERIAEDARKMERHCSKVRNRRAAIAKDGSIQPEREPRIVSMEHLSTGLVMLAWEGPADSIYSIDHYDEGKQEWIVAAGETPLYEGVGEWSEISLDRCRYYCVSGVKREVSAEHRLTGKLHLRESGKGGVEARVFITRSDGTPEKRAHDICIDGEPVSCEFEEGNGDAEIARIPQGNLLPGKHFVYVTMSNLGGTTPSTPDELASWGSTFRTETVMLEIPGTLPQHFVGFRTTNDRIVEGETTTFLAELPPHYEDWTLGVYDLDGDKVREWKGITDRKLGTSLSIPWDGRNSDNEIAEGAYEARLTLSFEWRGKRETKTLKCASLLRTW